MFSFIPHDPLFNSKIKPPKHIDRVKVLSTSCTRFKDKRI